MPYPSVVLLRHAISCSRISTPHHIPQSFFYAMPYTAVVFLRHAIYCSRISTPCHIPQSYFYAVISGPFTPLSILILKEIRVLPCSHKYHKKCVDKWLLDHSTCPCCCGDVAGMYSGNCQLLHTTRTDRQTRYHTFRVVRRGI